MGIQPEKRGAEKNDMRESVFLETDPISLFWGLLIYLLLEKAMAPHSRTLAWKIPWMEELDRLQSMGSQRVGHD